ncbi:hypothetical protein [Stigmatella aurantiaca]|nr:hypothetical protein [Stigmatella aurantiaca]
MRWRTSAWTVMLTVTLGALPSWAQVLELHQSAQPLMDMPDRGVFEELLFSFADPDRALEGGFVAPSLTLGIRARAWAFLPTQDHQQRDALKALSQPARDVTLSELPAGRHLASFLELGPDGGQVRVRDLGPRLGRSDSALNREFNEALDFLHVPKPAAVVSAGVLALGILHQLGTAKARSLGLPSSVRGRLLGGRMNASIRLQSEPRFRNARADMALRVNLPQLALASLRLEQLEVGGAAARTPEGVLLDTRWANLRGRLSWLELSLGVHSNSADPNLWTVLETGVQRDRFSVRTVLSQQWKTARYRFMATSTLRTGPVLSGLFLGTQDNLRRTFGLVGMGSF